ncbi:unnamed protein product [Gongylonema pulchrum]|uniref:Uncharacterized protein n=1 Tax=Gongylonema pulchrum TaxID=637853 RepID=A0A183DS38_9BILA|nr:unnamed protein product [Gongylonema pulchrum]
MVECLVAQKDRVALSAFLARLTPHTAEAYKAINALNNAIYKILFDVIFIYFVGDYSNTSLIFTVTLYYFFGNFDCIEKRAGCVVTVQYRLCFDLRANKNSPVFFISSILHDLTSETVSFG